MQRSPRSPRRREPPGERRRRAKLVERVADGAEGGLVSYAGDQQGRDGAVAPEGEALLDALDRAEQGDRVGEVVGDGLDGFGAAAGQEEVLDLGGLVGVAEAGDQVEVEVAV